MDEQKIQQQADQKSPATTGPCRTGGWPKLLIGLALLPCLGAFFMNVETDAPPLKVTREQPSLLFSSHMHTHREDSIKPGATLHSEFHFRNRSDQTVTVNSVERSCGCMTPRWTKTVAPGEIGVLRVPLDTIRQSPGFHEYLLTVNYTDTKPRSAFLTIKATFPEKMVVVQPRALYLSQRSSKPVDFSIAVSDFRDKPLRVTDVEATAAFVSADIYHKTAVEIMQASHTVESFDGTDADGSADDEAFHDPRSRTDIVGTVAGNIPPGHHHVLVTAKTNDPDFPVVSVPMIVQGPEFPAGEEAKLNVSHIQLDASVRSSARREGSVLLTAPTSWKISRVTAWPEELEVRHEAAGEPMGTHQVTRVRIKLADLPKSKTKHGLVQLIANDGKDLITVNVSLDWPESFE